MTITYLKYLVQHTSFVATLEQLCPTEHSIEDAAHGPHVDGRSVGLCAQQQLGGAEPPRHHGFSVLHWSIEFTGHAQISNLLHKKLRTYNLFEIINKIGRSLQVYCDYISLINI